LRIPSRGRRRKKGERGVGRSISWAEVIGRGPISLHISLKKKEKSSRGGGNLRVREVFEGDGILTVCEREEQEWTVFA